MTAHRSELAIGIVRHSISSLLPTQAHICHVPLDGRWWQKGCASGHHAISTGLGDMSIFRTLRSYQQRYSIRVCPFWLESPDKMSTVGFHLNSLIFSTCPIVEQAAQAERVRGQVRENELVHILCKPKKCSR